MAARTGPVGTSDQLEIQELVTRYNRAIDRGDIEGWVACFTPDGAFDGVLGRKEGAAALRAFATELTDGPEGERFRPMRHWTTNFVIDHDGDGDTALMRADHLLVRPRGTDGVELVLTAIYHDRLRRVDGRWLFVERVVEVTSQ